MGHGVAYLRDVGFRETIVGGGLGGFGQQLLRVGRVVKRVREAAREKSLSLCQR